jgi:hypothetical protein
MAATVTARSTSMTVATMIVMTGTRLFSSASLMPIGAHVVLPSNGPRPPSMLPEPGQIIWPGSHEEPRSSSALARGSFDTDLTRSWARLCRAKSRRKLRAPTRIPARISSTLGQDLINPAGLRSTAHSETRLWWDPCGDKVCGSAREFNGAVTSAALPMRKRAPAVPSRKPAHRSRGT